MDFASPDTPARWIRSRTFSVEHVALDIRVDLAEAQVSGVVEHRVVFYPHAPRTTIDLDCDGPQVEAVTIDGAPTTFSLLDGKLSIAVPPQAASHLRVGVRFVTDHPQKGLYFVREDLAKRQVAMAWTQGAMEDHHAWFPCFDDPNNLATYRIAITHRPTFVALANGDQTEERDGAEGWKTTVFEQRKAHVLYLLNVAVGSFVGIDDDDATVGDRQIPVRHWLPAGREDEVGVFRATCFGIEWLSRATGVPYAWSRYGHVVVHRFLWGGMENTTLTTITDRVLIDDETREREDVDADYLVIHELVHQWYGDLLTMKAWSDIWLNESFATWLECRGTAAWRASRGDGDERDLLGLLLWENREAYLEQESGRYQRPLVTNRYDDAYELFDRVAYEKGSLVLEHLAAVLGEERMRAALTLYTTRHAGDLVESNDFRQAIEDATGDPLDWFFAQWLERSGHPHLTVTVQHDAGRGQLLVRIEQKLADKAAPWRLPTAIAWQNGDAVERRAIELTRADEQFVLPCSAAPTWVCVDPDGNLPTEWTEKGSANSLLARALARELSAPARARACIAAGRLAASGALVAGLSGIAMQRTQPELVRREAIKALGALRGEEALQAVFGALEGLERPRLRRVAAEALAEFRHHHGATTPAVIAQRIIEAADAETSLLTAGELLAARGAIQHPGASPALRARIGRPSWNDRLAIGCLRGLGASSEAAAIDDVLPLLADRRRSDALRGAACSAAAQLGAEHLPARTRVRRALEALLADESMALRATAAKALARLGDPAASGALAALREREPYGNVRRVLRESLHALGKAAANTETQAALTKRIDEMAKENADLKRRFEALEKRLEPS